MAKCFNIREQKQQKNCENCPKAGRTLMQTASLVNNGTKIPLLTSR